VVSRKNKEMDSMVSAQNKQMAQFFALMTERMSRPGLDLATIRDVYENLHLAATEPEGVCYAEVDLDGLPALWCLPTDCDVNRVLLHAHGGGTVIFSMHLDRKAVGHIAKAAGARALVLDYRRSPEHKFPAQIEDMEKAYHWLLAKGIRAENVAVTGQSIGGNLAVSLAIELRNKGVAMPAAILSISGWYDMELKNDTIKNNAKNDKLLSRPILEWFREAWLGSTDNAWNDPRVNLVYADLAGLPPHPGVLRRSRTIRWRNHRVREASERCWRRCRHTFCFPRTTQFYLGRGGGYLKSTRQLGGWANGCGQDFGQLRASSLKLIPEITTWL
jgi:epsilon-lactone hydrolase